MFVITIVNITLSVVLPTLHPTQSVPHPLHGFTGEQHTQPSVRRHPGWLIRVDVDKALSVFNDQLGKHTRLHRR